MFKNPDERDTDAKSMSPSGEYHYTAENNPGNTGDSWNAQANPSHSGNWFYQNGPANPPQGGYPPYGAGPNNPNGGKKKQKRPKVKKERRPLSAGGLVAIALVCAIVGGLVGAGGVYAYSEGIVGKSTNVAVSDRTTATTVNTESVKAGDPMTSAQIYDKYSDAVVCITVSTSEGQGAGTGFIISKDGYILTCNHVVDGATAISVTLNDSTSYEAKLVGSDSDLDVAVLKVDPGDQTLTTVVLGDSSLLGVGDDVTVIGNALGTLANTLTTGSVSALDRAITMSDGTVMSLMQTDCTINSGNSGGPLFNQYGEVVGIVNAKYSSSAFDTSTASIEGIGFAIPINDVNEILDDLMEHGYVTGKPYLGISVSTVSAVTAQQYSNMVVGAYVNTVDEGSCAEKAGLQVGDIITQVDGKDITSSAELIDAKNTHKAGEEMKLTVYRAGQNGESKEANYLTLVVTLDEKQPEEETDDDNQQSGSGDYDYGYNFGGNNGNSGNNENGYSYSWPFGNWW